MPGALVDPLQQNPGQKSKIPAKRKKQIVRVKRGHRWQPTDNVRAASAGWSRGFVPQRQCQAGGGRMRRGTFEGPGLRLGTLF